MNRNGIWHNPCCLHRPTNAVSHWSYPTLMIKYSALQMQHGRRKATQQHLDIFLKIQKGKSSNRFLEWKDKSHCSHRRSSSTTLCSTYRQNMGLLKNLFQHRLPFALSSNFLKVSSGWPLWDPPAHRTSISFFLPCWTSQLICLLSLLFIVLLLLRKHSHFWQNFWRKKYSLEISDEILTDLREIWNFTTRRYFVGNILGISDEHSFVINNRRNTDDSRGRLNDLWYRFGVYVFVGNSLEISDKFPTNFWRNFLGNSSAISQEIS